MTCFWNGIINRLNKDDYNLLKIKPVKKRNISEIKSFINTLKKLSVENTFNILWQKEDLKKHEIEEMKTYIKEYNINQIHKGHLTSSCDPFLCLLTDLLKCKIEFNYRNHMILFQSKDKIRKVLRFRGSGSHFS